MTDQTLQWVLWTAATLGVLHTAIGVDHYLPFVVLGRAQNWSLERTLGITALCGVGHVLASVVLGILGIVLGLALQRLELFESFRGSIAAWLLIGFGFAYAAWGVWRMLKGKRHTHPHLHEDGTVHHHEHDHVSDHAHVHAEKRRRLTAIGLFIVFAFGPCEALIPLMMAPAVGQRFWAVALVVLVFGAATIMTMTALVAVGYAGIPVRRFQKFERYGHVAAGLVIGMSGLAIQVLGI